MSEIVMRTNRSLTKSDESHFRSKKTSESLKKMYCFHPVFDSFSLLFLFVCPRVNRSCRSFFSLQNSDGSDLLLEKSELLFRSLAHKKKSDLHEKPQSEFPTLYVLLTGAVVLAKRPHN